MPKAGGWLAGNGADFTFDPATPVGQVRLFTNESDAALAMFADAEITGYLNLNGFDVRLSAAQVLDVKAVWYVQTQGKSQIGGRAGDSEDGTAVAKSLKAAADELRRQVYEDGGSFDVIEMVTDANSFDERVWNQYLRQQ